MWILDQGTQSLGCLWVTKKDSDTRERVRLRLKKIPGSKKKKKKNPGSNKEKLLCEDSRLSTGFVSLKFSSGIVSKYHISLILGCIVPYTLETQIPMGLAIVTSINSSTDFVSDI